MKYLSAVIAPSFYPLVHDVMEGRHTYYWLKGGRGSCKSSFASVMIVLGMMRDPDANCVAIRRVAVNLKDSVFNQLLWAIEMLGVSEFWAVKLSPMELIYKPTGQKILFRGADKPQKIKSTKVSKGYIRYVWYEELAEFDGMRGIRTINQSLLRGGSDFEVFYTYNPPESQRNWVNTAVTEVGEDALVHSSTYLTVPREWLGEQFIADAEHLKEINPQAYRHEYLGEAVGTGGEVFTNLAIREIPDEEIAAFDRIKRGVDFGYAADPFVYVVCHYDSKHKRLFIFDEIYKLRLSNERAAEMIRERTQYRQYIVADSAEPKSIAEMRRYGLPMREATKGPDSVEYGVKFLQSLESIVIDRRRCPETAREFLNYELEPDGNDGFKDGYPDRDNHTIDAVRYAMEDEIAHRKARVLKRKEFF